MAGMALGCGLCMVAQPTSTIAVATVVASSLCSLLPDIDTASSRIGRRVAPLAWILRILFGHRQFFHSLLCWTIVTGAAWLCGIPQLVVIGILTGAGSHLLLDMLNPSGVQLLWPMLNRISIAKIRCGGFWDFILALLFTALALWLSYECLSLY